MLIVHIIVDLTPGGAELMLKRLISSQIRHPGLRHAVISLRSFGSVGPEIRDLGVEVRALGMSSLAALPSVIRRLRCSLRELRPDVVQTWMYHADLIGGLVARSLGLKRIVWGVRIADINAQMGVSRATSLIRLVCAAVSSRVPTQIVYVADSARLVHERLGYDPRKSIVIPNGYVIPALEQLRSQQLHRRQKISVPADAVLIGSAGRFNPQKDHRTFVAAASRVASAEPRAHFLMMGRGVDWQNEELAGWIRSGGYADRFHLMGNRSDIIDWLACLDIFCLHSVGEGFPNVVAEAMSVGVPCVVTDVGDAAVLVGKLGIVVPPSEPSALAGALLAMVKNGKDVRAELGDAARRRVAACYSIQAISRRYEELYEQLAKPILDKHSAAAKHLR